MATAPTIAPISIGAGGLSNADQLAVANAYVQGGGQAQNISYSPSITSSSLTPQPPITNPSYTPPPTPSTAPTNGLPPPPAGTAGASATTGATTGNTAGSTTDPNFGVAGAQSAYDQTAADLKAAFGEQATQTQKEQDLNASSGYDAATARVNELNAIDQGYAADLQNIASQKLTGTLAQQGTSTGELGRSINIKDLNYNAVAADQNVNIKRATNSSLIALAQGQQANAQNYVQKALDLQFKPLQSKIDYLTAFLKVNSDKLSTAEQAKLKYQIDQQTQAKTQAEADKTKVYETLTTAAKNGADNLTLQNIQKASTPEAAIAAAGRFMKTANTLSAAEQLNQQAITSATNTLTAAKGADSYTDPNLYARTRASSSLSATDFDNRFGYLVNPASAAKLGITKAVSSTGISSYTGPQQQSLIGAGIPATQLSTIEQYINQYGLQAALTNSDMTAAQKTAIKAVYGQ